MTSDITDTNPFTRWGLTPVINVSGTMTSIGASRVHSDVAAVVGNMLGAFVSMDELQSRASEVIAQSTGAEAGCVADCTAAAMVQSVAAAITGLDLAAIESLPDAGDRQNRVAMQSGHMINYGAPVQQSVAVAGGIVVPVGTAAQCETYHLRQALESGCAAALYVISHHTVREGELPLDLFVETCRQHTVPVIVDMASEYDLRTPIALGADLAIYSGHKFLAGTTSGIVAGSRDLVRATYLQHRGIGRCMKVGKEGVVGAMAALETWARRDAQAVKRKEDSVVAHWYERLSALDGLNCSRHEDWTGNPITRLKMEIDSARLGLHAWELASRLADRNPRIVVRDDLVEHGEIYLDPCNLTADEAQQVAVAIIEEAHGARRLDRGRRQTWSDVKRARERSILAWPQDRE